MAADETAFEVTADVTGKAFLLVDDILNTGAHLQSAASALQFAGADVMAAVPVAHLLDPGQKGDAALLARAQAEPFDFDVCALEWSRRLLGWSGRWVP